MLYKICLVSLLFWSLKLAMGQTISHVSLYDESTKSVIPGYEKLADKQIINLDLLPNKNLNLQIQTTPTVVGSVRTKHINGSTQTENEFPYTAYREDGTNKIVAGTYTYFMDAYSGPKGTGNKSPTKVISLTFTSAPTPSPTPTVIPTPTPTPTPTSVPGEEMSFHLYDETTKKIMTGYDHLQEGEVIDLQKLPSRNINIVVESKLTFASMMTSHNGSSLHKENIAPFTVLREDGTAGPKLSEGDHTFQVYLKSQTGGAGSTVAEKLFTLTFVEGDINDTEPPQILEEKLVNNSVVSVKTNEPTRAVLEFGKGTNLNEKVERKIYETSYNLLFPRLEPSTNYQYRVLVYDKKGNSSATAIKSFVSNEKPTRVFPGSSWATIAPEEVGLNVTRLRDAHNYLKSKMEAETFVIIKNGYLVHRGTKSKTRHHVWSCTKSFTSTVLGLLIDDGTLKLDDYVAKYVPALQSRYSKVQFKHFATMTSGYDAVGGRYGYNSMDGSTTPLDPTTPSFAPGTHYAYWDDAMNMYGNALSQAAKRNMSSVFHERVAKKIGLTNYQWSNLGTYNGITTSGGAGGRGPMRIDAEDMARFCYLYLSEGNWNGEQVLSKNWARAATSVQVPKSMPLHQKTQNWIAMGNYGYNWWVNDVKPDGKLLWPNAPVGSFAARGTQGNFCVAIPAWDMVLVRVGENGSNSGEVLNEFIKRVGAARQ